MLGVARLAGIQAVKRTAELYPRCATRCASGADPALRVRRPVQITATVKAFDQTGVEMEALTAVSVAALTVYDMTKAIDRGMGDLADPARREARRQERRVG